MRRARVAECPPLPALQRWGAILWPSFFSACVCTMVFFAFVDPLEWRDLTFPDWEIGREWGYTLGFFAFWSATASSSLFTWWLLRPAAQLNEIPSDRARSHRTRGLRS